MVYILKCLVFCLAAVTSLKLKQHKNYHLLEDKKCGTTPAYNAKPFITDGRYVFFGQFPWVAKIDIYRHYSNGYVAYALCGGSIINPKYILSAAHCFRGSSDVTKMVSKVILGDLNSTTAQDCDHWCMPRPQKKSVERIISNEDFTWGRTYGYDISLVRLTRPITYNDFVLPVCLPFAFVDHPTGTLEKALQDRWRCCDFSGWGIVEEQNHTSPTKLKSTMISYIPCKIPETDLYYICGSGLRGRPCDGDSGGALSVRTKTEDGFYISTAVGIAALGSGPCKSIDTITFFTNVTKVLDWILDNIQP